MDKSAMESLPLQVSASEAAQKNKKLWNAAHEVTDPPATIAAPAPDVSQARLPERSSVREIAEQAIPHGKHGAPNAKDVSPLSAALPESLSARQSAEMFLSPHEHSDQVSRNLTPFPVPPWSWSGAPNAESEKVKEQSRAAEQPRIYGKEELSR